MTTRVEIIGAGFRLWVDDAAVPHFDDGTYASLLARPACPPGCALVEAIAEAVVAKLRPSPRRRSSRPRTQVSDTDRAYARQLARRLGLHVGRRD